jgi:hypothetical protein
MHFDLSDRRSRLSLHPHNGTRSQLAEAGAGWRETAVAEALRATAGLGLPRGAAAFSSAGSDKR